MHGVDAIRTVHNAPEESSFAVLVALCAALFTTGVAYTLQCSTQYECVNAGTCRTFNDGTCSFSNVVSPAGYKVFNLSSDASALAALTRGVCPAGERQTINEDNRLVCVRAPAFPSAFNKEAADPSANSDHARNCGRWLKSKSTPSKTEYFAFYDETAIAADVTRELKAEFNPSVVIDDIDRFRAACERMIVNGAVAPAATNAYEFLKSEIGDALNSTAKLLSAMGKLVSHYCDAPVLMGVRFGSDSRFYATATDGGVLDSDAASEALYALGEPPETREMVRAFLSEMASAPSSLATPPSQTQLNDIVTGAIQGSWLDDVSTVSGPIVVLSGGTLDAGARFLYATKETDIAHARVYLLSVAAQCAFATRAATSGEFGSSISVKRATQQLRNRRRRAVSLGRLEFDEVERFSPVNSSVALDASTITWSRLARTDSIATSSTNYAHDACWSTTVMAFPDELDSKVLKRLTTPALLDTVLPPMISALKDAVAIGVQNGRVATLVADPVNRAMLANKARAVQFKIAGAPRNSLFGREGDFERPSWRSEDGALLMLLKQARSVFLDRISLALENSNLCDHPPLFPSLTRNAYLLTLAPCAMLLPAILVPPFASDRYDQRSLYGRLGFVIAHEVAHVASRPELWDQAERERLLSNYSFSTHLEAAADLTAADAIVATGKTSATELCADVSQIWCGRVPAGTTSPLSHPPANARGDRVCDFLRR